MRQLLRYFVQGLIVLLPIAATLWVLTSVFSWVDDLFPIRTPGLGFVAAVASATIVGWLASHLFGRWVVRVTDWIVDKIPGVKLLYGTVKDVVRAVTGDKKNFDKPVVVTLFPGGTAKILGFVTRDDLSDIGLPGEVAVLIQQSFNFAGNLMILPKEQVRPLQVDAAAFMTYIMSGGLTGHLTPEAVREHFPKLE